MKIAFFITSNLYVRNYIENGLFNKIQQTYNLDCFLTNEVSLLVSVKSKKFQIPKTFRRLSAFLNDLRTIKYRYVTKSFLYRFNRQRKSSKNSLLNFLIFSFKVLMVKSKLSYFFLEKFIKNYSTSLRHNQLISNYDLIVIPNSGFDCDFDYLIKLSKNNSVLSYMLVDNWDNLSSKSIMMFKPSYLAVMSEQCLNHAIEIQGISREKIYIIGNSRFEIYKNPTKPLFDFKYILFAGCNLPYNEINALKVISKSIEDKKLKIIYRPHPWRQKRNNENFDEIDKLSNVIIDPQISSAFNKIGDVNFQPELDYYNNLIKNSIYVISPLSTFVLEALICKKPVIVLIEDEINNFTSPLMVYNNYKHFEDIHHISNCYLLNNLNNFSSFHSKLFKEDNYTEESKNKGIKYHVLFDEKKYLNYLLDSFDKIIEKNS